MDLTTKLYFQFIIAALALVAAADRPSYPAPTPAYGPRPVYPAPAHGSYKPIAILEEENVHPGDGTYNFHFNTENGIYRSVTHLVAFIQTLVSMSYLRELSSRESPDQ